MTLADSSTNSKPLSATLLLTADLARLSEPQIRLKLRECHRCGFDLLIPTLAAEHGHSYAPSKVLPRLKESRFSYAARRAGVPISLGDLDIWQVMLDECDRLGMRMFMPTGTLCPEKPGTSLMWPYPPAQWFDDKARHLNERFIDELARRYAGHDSFAGWYISDEMKWSIDEQVPLVEAVARACRQAKAGVPVMMSPAPAHQSPHTAALSDPTAVGRLDVDIIAPMDAGELCHRGANAWDENTFQTIERSHRATAAACAAASKTYWSNIELFVYDHDRQPNVPRAAPWERIDRQITLASRYAQRLACFQFFTLADAPDSEIPLGENGAITLYQAMSARHDTFKGKNPR